MMKQFLNEWRDFIKEERGAISSGVLLYKTTEDGPLVYLVHAGGPFHTRSKHAWGIPKGLSESGESIEETAKREFEEEMGVPLPNEFSFDLGFIKTSSGKSVFCFACEGDLPEDFQPKSNMFPLEYQGKVTYYPEIDQGRWFTPEEAMQIINSRQAPFVERLVQQLQK